MATTWIVVAESSRARFYSAESRKSDFTELEDLVHPESRLHNGDLVSDEPGSDRGSPGEGRHVVDDESNPKKLEISHFAHEIAKRLEAGYNDRVFGNLILIAPPAFLGVLRDELSKAVRRLVSEEVDKNLVHESVDVIRDHISVNF
jgi:protein required for attachment to host cells